MPDWTKSMQQTYEYMVVDPGTWKDVKPLRNVLSCDIERDDDSDTLGSASFSITGTIGECYIRVYLVTIQNGVRESHPLGTFIVQTPSESFDGRVSDNTIDAYTPLLELKENPPPIGYYIPKKENAMDYAYRLVREHARAPVARPTCPTTLFYDFVADTNDSWLSFISDLAVYAKHSLSLDEMGRILFAPEQDMASLQPVWTFNDNNSSILFPEITVDHDLYNVPNIVEVSYSSATDFFHARAVNDDPNSPTSTINRGRPITRRITDPSVIGNPTERQIQEYADQMLRNLSTLEYSVKFTHGYCPVRIGDCVRLNYEAAGIYNVKAKIVSQSIKCKPGCPVTTKAIFTRVLWR